MSHTTHHNFYLSGPFMFCVHTGYQDCIKCSAGVNTLQLRGAFKAIQDNLTGEFAQNVRKSLEIHWRDELWWDNLPLCGVVLLCGSSCIPNMCTLTSFSGFHTFVTWGGCHMLSHAHTVTPHQSAVWNLPFSTTVTALNVLDTHLCRLFQSYCRSTFSCTIFNYCADCYLYLFFIFIKRLQWISEGFQEWRPLTHLQYAKLSTDTATDAVANARFISSMQQMRTYFATQPRPKVHLICSWLCEGIHNRLPAGTTRQFIVTELNNNQTPTGNIIVKIARVYDESAQGQFQIWDTRSNSQLLYSRMRCFQVN